MAGDLDSSHGTLFKFTLRNLTNESLQIISWLDTKDTVKSIVKDGYIIHVDGGYAKPKSNTSLGTSNVEVHISSLTKLELMGQLADKFQCSSVPKDLRIFTNVEQAISHKGVIAIDGFLKYEIEDSEMPYNGIISQGCMANYEMKWKIKVRLKTLQKCSIVEGQHIRVIGEIVRAPRSYILVADVDNIKVLSHQTQGFIELLEVNETPYKPEFVPKKLKYEN